ncbi:hypothetical protein RFI_19671, partial [Reticulomyxa filosa]
GKKKKKKKKKKKGGSNFECNKNNNREYELFVEVELFQKGMRLGLPVCCTYKLFPEHQKW